MYQSQTKRSTLQKRYGLERDLKSVFYGYVGLVESAFKNALCYHTCRKLGNDWRTNPTNIKNPKVVTFLNPLLNACNEYRKGNKKGVEKKYLAIVKNYCDKFSLPLYPPLRNIMDTLSFGDIGYLYRSLADRRLQLKIATKEYHLNPKQLEILIKAAVQIRNIVYHNNHLIFYKISPQSLTFIQASIAKVISTLPVINHKFKGFLNAVAIMYVLLLPLGEADNFLQEVKEVFDAYDLREIKIA
jgi:abortive infection bacteriophage resistance protein